MCLIMNQYTNCIVNPKVWFNTSKKVEYFVIPCSTDKYEAEQEKG